MAGLTKVTTTEKPVNKKQLGAFQAAMATAKKGGLEKRVLEMWRAKVGLPATATATDIEKKLGSGETSTAKKQTEKVVELKKEKAPKEHKPNKLTELISLLTMRDKTDEEMVAVLKKNYASEKQAQSRLCTVRRELNAGKFEDYKLSNKIERLYRVDGKLIPKSQMPKTDRVKKPKYTPENDPLAKVAGIIVKPKETKSAAEPSGKK